MDAIWEPSQERKDKSLLTEFSKKFGKFPNYDSFHTWSISNPAEFWQGVWDFCGVVGDRTGPALEDIPEIEHARFFPERSLNFAENLLTDADDSPAITFLGEDKVRITITRKELRHKSICFAKQLKQWNVKPGDRVAALMPNMAETVIAMLGASAIGATFTTCSPDFGVKGVIDRFSQIEPTILVVCNGYYYNGKSYGMLDHAVDILKQLPSIKETVIVSYIDDDNAAVKSAHRWEDLNWKEKTDDFVFEKFPFNHHLYMLYSSGTTGVPKGIVHGAGGTLLQHLKEHQLQCDIKPGHKFFYFTTVSWMMWHWLVSGLASKAHIFLYDGAPTYPNYDALFDYASKYKWDFLGTSAKYLSLMQKTRIKVNKNNDLSNLKTIASTGSPLLPETFDYVYKDIKKDVCLASISGGTDIISCFNLCNPWEGIYRGELQCAGLGMDIDVFDDEGRSLKSEQGELVCKNNFPNMPTSFWNDKSGERFHNSYFATYKNIWHHGDFIEKTKHNGYIIHGRSDSVLKPSGVRIGTAELYRQVEQVSGIVDCLAIGQKWKSDERIVLFVVLEKGLNLTNDLIDKIKDQIRENTTLRHVPARIIAVPDVPRTKNGKLAEIAVRKVVHGEEVKNKSALLNPDCLDSFNDLPELR